MQAPQFNQSNNAAPTGAPEIRGISENGATLTVTTSSIADANGLGTFGYQWMRDGAAISGATSSDYTVGAADVGRNLTVVVSYTDGEGTDEAVISGGVYIVEDQSSIGGLSVTQNILTGALTSEFLWTVPTVVYGFYEEGVQYDSTPSDGGDGISDGWSEEDKDKVRGIFDELESFMQLSFFEVQNVAVADIAFAQDTLTGGVAGYAFSQTRHSSQTSSSIPASWIATILTAPS